MESAGPSITLVDPHCNLCISSLPSRKALHPQDHFPPQSPSAPAHHLLLSICIVSPLTTTIVSHLHDHHPPAQATLHSNCLVPCTWYSIALARLPPTLTNHCRICIVFTLTTYIRTNVWNHQLPQFFLVAITYSSPSQSSIQSAPPESSYHHALSPHQSLSHLVHMPITTTVQSELHSHSLLPTKRQSFACSKSSITQLCPFCHHNFQSTVPCHNHNCFTLCLAFPHIHRTPLALSSLYHIIQPNHKKHIKHTHTHRFAVPLPSCISTSQHLTITCEVFSSSS